MPLLLCIALAFSLSCGDGSVRLTLLHINDVYEIAPLGDDQGGLARVATLKKQLQRANEHTWMILAGDLFSPSALGIAEVDGEPLAGRQIVDVMRRVGLDYATFGNHEFDLKKAQFHQRLTESLAPSQEGDASIGWLSSNVFDGSGIPFAGVPSHFVVPVGPVKVGLFGLTLDNNQKEYVQYDDRYAAMARIQVHQLRREKQADIVIAITHLERSQDSTLAATIPGIDLILGGHEHENMRVPVYYQSTDSTGLSAMDSTLIYKADANARTAYIHDLTFDTATRQLRIDSRLQTIDGQIDEEPTVAALVDEWVEKAFAGFRATGLHPRSLVATPTEDLDGLEASVRTRRTRLTELLADGMRHSVVDTSADLALFNGGSIRIDDVLPAGSPLREYDIVRILPYGGVMLPVDIKGDRLQVLLNAGQRSQGAGGYLQTSSNVSFRAPQWFIDDRPLDPERRYLVAINDYVLTGRQTFEQALAPDASTQERAALFSSYIHLIRNRVLAIFNAAANPDTLDQKRIPAALVQALQQAHQARQPPESRPLSEAEITVRTSGSEWLVKEKTDQGDQWDRMYFVRRVDSKLIVYDTFSTLGQALNNALENYVHVYARQSVATIEMKALGELLDAEQIPDALCQALVRATENMEGAKKPVPDHAAWRVAVGQKGSQWLMTATADGMSQTYFVKKYAQQLIAYDTVDMRQILIEQLKTAYP